MAEPGLCGVEALLALLDQLGMAVDLVHRKIEPKFFVVERFLGLVRGDVLAGGLGELGLFPLLTLALELTELGDNLDELAIESRFLNAEVVELAVIGEVGVRLDQTRAEFGRLVVKV